MSDSFTCPDCAWTGTYAEQERKLMPGCLCMCCWDYHCPECDKLVGGETWMAEVWNERVTSKKKKRRVVLAPPPPPKKKE